MMRLLEKKPMLLRTIPVLVAAGVILICAAQLQAQSVDYSQQTRPPSEEKQGAATQPNRSGVYEGVNIQDNTVVINGKSYPTLINPSRVPTLANGNPIPLLMIPEGTRIQFHVDKGGRITSVWVNGALTQ